MVRLANSHFHTIPAYHTSRWPKSAQPLTGLHCQVSPSYDLTLSHFDHLHQYPLTMSSTPYVGCRSVRLLTLFRRKYVLKRIADLTAPFVAVLFSCSLESGRFPSGFKEAFITPVMKKSGLDSRVSTPLTMHHTDLAISNLSAPSKLLERIATRQAADLSERCRSLATITVSLSTWLLY